MKTISTTKASALSRLFELMLVLLPAAAVLGLSGCNSTKGQHPVERTVDAESERMLWEALRLAVFNADFKVGSGADPGSRMIRSGWNVDLAPFKSRGFRTRVIACYEPATGERKGVATSAAAGLEAFDVTIRVEKETNESLSPLNLDRAEWTKAEDDLAAARGLMQAFHSLLGTVEFELEKPETIFGIE